MKGSTRSWVNLMVAIITWMVVFEPICDAADLTLNLQGTSSAYTKLLDDVRNKVKDPNLRYGGTNLPVVAAPKTPATYLYIDLIADKGTVTVAFSKNDLYLAGYLDNIRGTKKAHFFQDAPADAKKTVFPDAKSRVDMSFKGSYIDLEKKAGDRGKIGLGVTPLKKYINKLYQDSKLDVKSEAEFMLVVIQTIAEAARFKYIENNIVKNFAGAYNPDAKGKTLEKNWATTTKAIKGSNNGSINPPLILKDDSGKEVGKWSQVSELAKEMGLLKYEGKSLSSSFYEVLVRFRKVYYYRQGEDLPI